jgi:hypothetical protein
MTDDPRAAAFEQALTDKVMREVYYALGRSDRAARAVIINALLKAAPPAEGPTCEWFSDLEDDSMLTTACGQEFYRLEDSAPTLAWMKFCCYCGKRVSLPTPPRDPAGKE